MSTRTERDRHRHRHTHTDTQTRTHTSCTTTTKHGSQVLLDDEPLLLISVASSALLLLNAAPVQPRNARPCAGPTLAREYACLRVPHPKSRILSFESSQFHNAQVDQPGA